MTVQELCYKVRNYVKNMYDFPTYSYCETYVLEFYDTVKHEKRFIHCHSTIRLTELYNKYVIRPETGGIISVWMVLDIRRLMGRVYVDSSTYKIHKVNITEPLKQCRGVCKR